MYLTETLQSTRANRLTKHQACSHEPGKKCKTIVVYGVDAPSFAKWQEVTGIPVSLFIQSCPLVREPLKDGERKKRVGRGMTPLPRRELVHPQYGLQWGSAGCRW